MFSKAVSRVTQGALLLTVFGMAAAQSGSQRRAADTPAAKAACGDENVSFAVSNAPAGSTATQPPEGKALVYFFDDVAHLPLSPATIVKLGVDGRWVGATKDGLSLSFVADAGVHHICSALQGRTYGITEGGINLHSLRVEAGKTYYLRYRLTLDKAPSMIAMEEVDADEGQLLLQTSEPAVSRPK